MIKPKDLPKKINVFGTVYSVRVEDLLKHGGAGYMDTKENVIAIDAGQQGESLSSTVLHELFHAVFSRIGAQQAVQQGVEEMLVESLSVFMVENKDLMIKLLKG